ncbi:dTDP-4-dehydrorhamnose 3,5-epimerase [Parabacteroides sp. 52]|uniref:dTDP-4-dehydrorhamnose 3,5-epimerase n=1 Tax=unclassified Parabacteroides TaxID=2649774 RepID=UPI0013D685E3|nr:MULTISPECIES: dTDP-4-dehydrorhamnose 3,5-epimerase [unclassified Parabacteroides]MDH6534013.1 dTDP-4-dehydrorhamnose 3,5-epimerase [Parabacteroides sp. PM5-20]NDV54754.1 dTDP-4-dehydrorhamnose 3,5-epimerase [Parabacteroides sp. 52]
MTFKELDIPGVWLIEPKVFKDGRGYFMESFKQKDFEENIGVVNFVQENESFSSQHVLRGLHYQLAPYAQAKLVRVIEGEVLDVAVDVRIDSPTFGKYVAVLLSGENKKQLFVPRGFAHGFKVMSATALFQYKVDNLYKPEYEAGVLYNDPAIGIDWRIADESAMLLSDKDKVLPLLSAAKLNIRYTK